MHEKVQVHELPPVPWVRERDVDLLLAEVFATEPEFITWLLGRSLRRPAELPGGAATRVHAVVNYSRPDASATATGESDVVVSAEYPTVGGLLVLSVEDKVWAAPQRNQGQRHRDFVEQQGAKWGLAVLVAPRDWIDGHPGEADDYHLAVALEDVAAWCRARGFAFRASVFEQACVPPLFDFAPDLQDWHSNADQLLREELGLRLEPQRFVRTRNQGKAKPNRWASCEVRTLDLAPGVEQPRIVLKPPSTNHTSRAVIEIKKAPSDLVELAALAAKAEGFDVRGTQAGTLLIENPVPEASQWAVNSPFDEQVGHVLAVGRAAVELRAWWNGLVRQLGDFSR